MTLSVQSWFTVGQEDYWIATEVLLENWIGKWRQQNAISTFLCNIEEREYTLYKKNTDHSILEDLIQQSISYVKYKNIRIYTF